MLYRIVYSEDMDNVIHLALDFAQRCSFQISISLILTQLLC